MAFWTKLKKLQIWSVMASLRKFWTLHILASYLAVPDSSICDLVTDSSPMYCNVEKHYPRTIWETCDPWDMSSDNDYEWWGDMNWPKLTDNREQQYQHLHCDPWIKSDGDSICNSYDVQHLDFTNRTTDRGACPEEKIFPSFLGRFLIVVCCVGSSLGSVCVSRPTDHNYSTIRVQYVKGTILLFLLWRTNRCQKLNTL